MTHDKGLPRTRRLSRSRARHFGYMQKLLMRSREYDVDGATF